MVGVRLHALCKDYAWFCSAHCMHWVISIFYICVQSSELLVSENILYMAAILVLSFLFFSFLRRTIFVWRWNCGSSRVQSRRGQRRDVWSCSKEFLLAENTNQKFMSIWRYHVWRYICFISIYSNLKLPKGGIGWWAPCQMHHCLNRWLKIVVFQGRSTCLCRSGPYTHEACFWLDACAASA